jgi:hypothetical protein
MLLRLLWLFHVMIAVPPVALAADDHSENLLQADQLVYSNTLGYSAVAYGAGTTIADDITITGADGCQLARYEFDVSGNTDGEGAGPFAIDFELFDDCPTVGGLPIAGTQGHFNFPNEGKYAVAFPIPGNVHIVIPRTVWLAVTFDRDHAGWVGGAPALVGYSDDWFYHSAVGCGFYFGGYPGAPHSSMNARLHVRDSCPQVHPAYHAKTPRRGPFNPGEGLRMADDIALDGPCRMVAYEVTVRGTALYEMDLRLPGMGGFPAQVITDTTRSVQHFGSFIRTLRQDFNPPIPLPQDVWFTIAASSTVGRTSVVGLPARIGSSHSGYAVFNGATWELRQFPENLFQGALELTILCEGPAIMGACCDMQHLDSDGEAMCREVTRANCPYPAPGSEFLPTWREGDSCAPDPFNPPCGTAACCRADGTCMNYTQNYCAPRGVSWTRGVYCGSPEIACESVCLLSEEPCSLPHTTPGCINPFCCAEVCSMSGQAFCCQVAWDAGCASQAALTCGLPPANNECYPAGNGQGARLVTSNSNTDADTINATETESDPGFCCHTSGAGKRGVGTVWFRFVATSTTARVRTCQSSAPASDSLLQVFEAGDASTPETACATLRSIGCSDDVASCSSGGRNSQLCLRNLTVGRTYYVMLAAKNDESRGLYKLSISTSCSDAAQPKCDCPSGLVQWLDPPSGVVDARRPHPRTDAAAREGISSFVVQAPLGSDKKDCWILCETAFTESPNEVLAASYLEPGKYSIELKRPITPDAATTLTLNGDAATRGVFHSHPANVNADTASGPTDLLDLIDTLNGVRFLPWGLLSGDVDRSGLLAPADILETIDLLNGTDEFTDWNGVARPDPSPCIIPP